MFETVVIRDPQNFASDHFALQARLIRQPTRCQGGYLRGRRAFTLALGMVTTILVYTMFQALKDTEKPTPPLTRAPMPWWMLSDPLRLIGVRAYHRRRPDHNQNAERTLTKAVQKLMTVDTCRRAEVLV